MPKPIKDLTLYQSDLSFFPPEDKNSLWISQMLFFMKNSYTQFLDSKRWREYNKIDRMELDTAAYIQMIDPKTEMGGGGKAEYFASDFKEIPIAQHLDNILRAKLDKIGIENQLQVNEIDKYAVPQRQKAKERLLYQGLFRSVINEVNALTGDKPISTSTDPFKYVEKLMKDGKGADSVDTIVDYIKSQISDSQDIALFMSYVYKGDIEKAFELGIQHYLINLNKWSVECQAFNNDIKNFNRVCGEWYTDQTSGRGTVKYLNPTILYTNPFSSYNGEDITGWFYEEDISFADFVRRFGKTLSDEQLQEVFELNKNQGGCHGMNWNKAKGAKGSNANIRIGRGSVLTQDAEKFSQKYVDKKIPVWERKPLSWLPNKYTPNGYKTEMVQKMYNVWYSWYYVPPPGSKLSRNSQTDWAWQSQFIFDLKKDIDMYRYGVDMRYAKSTLVIYKDPRPSYTDIKEAFMPKIRTEWHKFQNCIVNDVSGVFIANDVLGAVLKATDEGNKINPDLPGKPTGGNGTDAGLQTFRMMRQAGFAMMTLRDTQGKQITNPKEFFIDYDNKMLDKAEKHLKIILDQYNIMKIALSTSDIAEGQDAKPRTNAEGIQASLAAGDLGNWFTIKAAREFLIMYGERCVQWIMYVIKEHKKYKLDERWKELEAVLGVGNALALESIEDFDPEQIGMTVELEDVAGKKQFYSQLAVQMLKDGKIAQEDLELITSTIEQNYKFGSTLLTISAKKMAKEQAHKEELQFEREKEIEQTKLQTALALQGAKGQAKDQNILTEGKVQAMLDKQLAELKHQSQMEIKEKMKDNKLEELGAKGTIEENKQAREKIAEGAA